MWLQRGAVNTLAANATPGGLNSSCLLKQCAILFTGMCAHTLLFRRMALTHGIEVKKKHPLSLEENPSSIGTSLKAILKVIQCMKACLTLCGKTSFSGVILTQHLKYSTL